METIGKYRIIGALGQGGFGHVYKAEDPAIGNIVAIKVLNVQNDENMLRRFRAEAVTSVRLRHKNIVTIFDFEEHNGIPYLIMEYLDGENLQRLVENRHTVPTINKLSIMSEVAEGLQYAHEQGVIHRDIKPANIMRLRDGSVKIMDFGIARLIQRDSRLTAVGYIVGTPEYMAPEQFMGDTIDLQVDVWAYGVVFYEFLTGRNPFAADIPGKIMYKVTHEDPPPVCDQAPELPRSLDPILRRLLAKKKADRYPDLEDLRVDLGMVIQELGEAEVAGMEKDAESLIQAGRYDEALAMAGRILRFDHRNAKARKWRSELRFFQKESRIKTLIGEADEKAAVLDFPTAESRLQEALQIDPDNSAARTRLVQIHEVREKKARAQRLLEEAHAEWERQNFSGAFERASEAAQNDPASSEASEFLNRVRQAIEQQKAETRRKSGLSRASGKLLAQDYAGAVITLQELDRQYPGDSEIRTRIEEAQRLQAVGATEKRVAAALSQSRAYLSKGAIQEAIDLLSGLDREAGRNAEVMQLLSFARNQREQHQREAEIEKLLAAAADAGIDYERALVSIARALELSPGNEKALRLRETVLANRRRDEQTNAIDGELKECRDLMDEGRLQDAETRARALWKRNPDNPWVQKLIRDLGERFRAVGRPTESRKLEMPPEAGVTGLRRTLDTNEQRRQNLVAAARAEAARLCTQKDYAAAIEILTGINRGYPDDTEIQSDLRQAIAARDRAARREAYMESRGAVLELMKGQRIDDAVTRLRELAAAFPDEPQAENDLRRAVAHRDEMARKAAFAKERESLQGLKTSREFDQALFKTRELLAIFPQEPELVDILERAREARDRAARKEDYEQRRKDFEELVRNRDFDNAVTAVERLIAEFPEEPELQEDLRRARAARDQAQHKTA
jgi:serine/threonine-protein kinase